MKSAVKRIISMIPVLLGVMLLIFILLRQGETYRRLQRSLFLRKIILQVKTAYWLMFLSAAGSVFLTDIMRERSVTSPSCCRRK